MATEDHTTHAELASRLRESIARLRMDVEARSDAVLGEIAEALELLLSLTEHAHDHVLTNHERIRGLESDS